MSVSETTERETPVLAGPKTANAKRVGVLVLSVVLIAAVVLVGLALNVQRPKAGLHVFADGGGMIWGHGTVGHTQNYVGILQDQPPTIAAHAVLTIDSITPVVVKDSARASLRFVMCDNVGVTGGSDADLARSGCVHPIPAIGGKWQIYQYGRPNNTIVARVTPTVAGVVQFGGYRIRYHSGSQTGDQIVGDSFKLTVR